MKNRVGMDWSIWFYLSNTSGTFLGLLEKEIFGNGDMGEEMWWKVVSGTD
jgi:hypothetical protein